MRRLRIVIGAVAVVSISPALAIVGGAPPAPENLARSVVMVVGSFGTLCTATVIAPDLPGIGDSAIPKDSLDMKSAAARIHALARSLGVTKARVVGHDIGLMVAYAYAAQFPTETEKLVEMDALENVVFR